MSKNLQPFAVPIAPKSHVLIIGKKDELTNSLNEFEKLEGSSRALVAGHIWSLLLSQ